MGNAVIYYAFDNGVNSNRYPYYSYMKDYWSGFGLDTHLDMMVTVSDLKRMADYDLAVLSAPTARTIPMSTAGCGKAGHRAHHPVAGKI